MSCYFDVTQRYSKFYQVSKCIEWWIKKADSKSLRMKECKDKTLMFEYELPDESSTALKVEKLTAEHTFKRLGGFYKLVAKGWTFQGDEFVLKGNFQEGDSRPSFTLSHKIDNRPDIANDVIRRINATNRPVELLNGFSKEEGPEVFVLKCKCFERAYSRRDITVIKARDVEAQFILKGSKRGYQRFFQMKARSKDNIYNIVAVKIGYAYKGEVRSTSVKYKMTQIDSTQAYDFIMPWLEQSSVQCYNNEEYDYLSFALSKSEAGSSAEEDPSTKFPIDVKITNIMLRFREKKGKSVLSSLTAAGRTNIDTSFTVKANARYDLQNSRSFVEVSFGNELDHAYTDVSRLFLNSYADLLKYDEESKTLFIKLRNLFQVMLTDISVSTVFKEEKDSRTFSDYLYWNPLQIHRIEGDIIGCSKLGNFPVEGKFSDKSLKDQRLIIEFEIRNRISQIIKITWESRLCLAVEKMNVLEVQALLKADLNPFVLNSCDQSALDLAVAKESFVIVKELIESMEQTKYRKKKAFYNRAFLEAIKRDLGDISLLLSNYSDLKALDENGNSALHLAAQNDNDELSQILLKRGADPLLLNIDRKSALDIAVENNSPKTLKLLIAAIEASKHKRKQDALNKAFLLAAKSQDLTMVQLLLPFCDIETKDEDGNSALKFAVDNENWGISNFLLSNGAYRFIEGVVDEAYPLASSLGLAMEVDYDGKTTLLANFKRDEKT